MSISFKRLECFVFNHKIELSSETHTAHHAQWVIRECYIRVKRRSNNAIFQIFNAIEGVYQFTEPICIEAYSHGIYGEIATVLVVFQRTVFYDWLTRITVVAFSASTNKLNFNIMPFYLCRTKITEDRQMCFTTQHLLQFASHLNATTNYNNVNIVGWTFKKNVTHIATDNITFQPQFISSV